MNIVLSLAVAILVHVVTLNLDLGLNVGQRLSNHWLDNKQNLAKADCVLEYFDQVLIFISDVFDLLSELFFNADKVSQLALKTAHLLVLEILILRLQPPLHLIDLLLPVLVCLYRGVVLIHGASNLAASTRISNLLNSCFFVNLTLLLGIGGGKLYLAGLLCLLVLHASNRKVLAHFDVLLYLHPFAVKVMLKPISDLLAKLLQRCLAVFKLAASFKVALKHRVNFFTVETVHEHVVLE